MVGINLGPKHDLATRLSKADRAVRQLGTRDILQNASIGAGGLTVENGGSIEIMDGGSLTLIGGGSVTVNGIDVTVSLAALNASTEQLEAAEAALATAQASLATAQADLANTAMRAASVAASLTLTSTATDTGNVIDWSGTVAPSITFNTPSSMVVVTIGAVCAATSTGESEMEGFLGYIVNGAAPSTNVTLWPLVDSLESPVVGTAAIRVLTATAVVAVNPNVPQTISAAYGYASGGGVAGDTAVFTNRYITIVPVPVP
jgi:hypothetical protein